MTEALDRITETLELAAEICDWAQQPIKRPRDKYVVAWAEVSDLIRGAHLELGDLRLLADVSSAAAGDAR